MCRPLLPLLSLFLMLPALALEVPPLRGHVNDLAALLDPASRARIETKLTELERDKGAQVAILTIPSLDDEVLEDYALRVAEQWKLGRKGVDDGLLILIAKKERKIRIEVGYGLEDVIPDLAAGRIIDRLMKPRFRQGDYAGGIEAAVDAIAGAIRGKPDALPPATDGAPGFRVESLLFLGFFSVVLAPFIRGILATPSRQWIVHYLFLTPFLYAFPAALLGTMAGIVVVVLWLILVPILRYFGHWAPPTSSGPRGNGRGGWWGGGFGGGGFSGGGGGFGGGGFSGGGGGFGGGGASGGW